MQNVILILLLLINSSFAGYFTYTSEPATYTVNDTITPNIPRISGGKFYELTYLPIGLTFNDATGVISGVPTVVTPAAIYKILFVGTGYLDTATIRITIIAPVSISSVKSKRQDQILFLNKWFVNGRLK